MHAHSQGGGDLVVSLDAFKVTRHDSGRRWEVRALTPYARQMLIQASKGIWNPDPTEPSFERRRDALDFISDLERAGEGWR